MTILNNKVSRRDFLWISSLSAAGFITGCAVNPVTGKSQLMLVSEETEVQIDKQYAPHQFSADYGVCQDRALNNYISNLGKKMAAETHRPDMPYNFQALNSPRVNAYTFPAGSVGITRGILVHLDNEAELAALMGHELGHVNARHSAERMTKSKLTSVVMQGVGMVLSAANSNYAQLATQLGMVGGTLLLAKYSRDNEREADSLAIEYMTKIQMNPQGCIGLMDMLQNLNKHNPGLMDIMFASHPMSKERYETAVNTSKSKYSFADSYPLNRERYMDNTANLRKIQIPLQNMQYAEQAMAAGKFSEAETQLQNALRKVPGDYAALLLTSKCKLVQKQYSQAAKFANEAKQAHPQEAQAYNLAGLSKIYQKQFSSALNDLDKYDKILPGNPDVIFLKGRSFEGMNRKENAASHYTNYLKQVNSGDRAKYAYNRLIEWGYIKQ